jgi:hypothetical protein
MRSGKGSRCKVLRSVSVIAGFMQKTAKTARRKRGCSMRLAVRFIWQGISMATKENGSCRSPPAARFTARYPPKPRSEHPRPKLRAREKITSHFERRHPAGGVVKADERYACVFNGHLNSQNYELIFARTLNQGGSTKAANLHIGFTFYRCNDVNHQPGSFTDKWKTTGRKA